MNVALKEWASITEALASGTQIAILRKGGIVEAARAGFEIRHREFLFFPTHEHQHAASLRPEFAPRVQPIGDLIPIRVVARVTDVLTAPAARSKLLDPEFIWNSKFLDMRYDYRPDLPLWLIVIRAAILPAAVGIPNRPSYAGCKSWVNLTEEIETAAAQPVLDDPAFTLRRQELLDRLK